MFSRIYRLSSRAAKYVSRRGRSVSGTGLRVKWTPSRDRVSKATVVTPLFFDKRATRRNRIKRQVREILRPLLPKISPAVNLMVYVGKGAKGRKFSELSDELAGLLKRARLI